MINKILSILILFVLIIMGDKQYAPEYGSGLPFNIDDKENNRALLFTMTDEQGRTRNIELMKSVFEDGKLGFICESYHNKPSKEIYSKIKEVVEKIDSNGTLLLYLNSHGGGSGSNFGMSASGGSLKFSKVIGAIASVKKLKRIIVLVDTCHAEGAINEGFQGGGKLIKNINTTMMELPEYYGSTKIPFFMKFFEDGENKFYYGKDSGAYEEMMIITSSSAADLSMRGTFALNFKKAFEKVKPQENAKVLDFLKAFASFHSRGGQQPYYKCVPDTILNELLFKDLLARNIPIVNKSEPNISIKKDYILVP